MPRRRHPDDWTDTEIEMYLDDLAHSPAADHRHSPEWMLEVPSDR